jgi:hypothetical protein
MPGVVLLLVWMLVAQGLGYWCPMHPDQRAAAPASCPICRMPMVPVPPLRVGEYRMDVELLPGAEGRGIGGVRLVVRDPDTHTAVSSFDTVHERPFHLFIIRRDFSQFLHVHPDVRADGTVELRESLPAGEYVLVADFLPSGGVPQTLQRIIVTPGFNPPAMAAPKASVPAAAGGPHTVTVDGIRATLEVPEFAATRDAHLQFRFSDAATGAPVHDLQPYLGAPAHLLLVSEDATEAIHGHPEGADTTGPVVDFDVIVPSAGPYRLWVQIQRGGRVVTFPFALVATAR